MIARDQRVRAGNEMFSRVVRDADSAEGARGRPEGRMGKGVIRDKSRVP